MKFLSLFTGIGGLDLGSLSILSESASRHSGQLWRFRREAEGKTGWNLYWQDGQSPVSRVADGVPDRLERVKGIGSAVSPIVAEWIGKKIMESQNESPIFRAA